MTAMLMMIAASLCFFVACNKEEVDPSTPAISVDQTTVSVPASGGDITLTVTANRPWKLTDNINGEKWLLADKTEGDGDAVITLTVAPNSGVMREADIRIATSTVYADVRITQPGVIATEVLYADDFGTGASNTSGNWPLVSEWTAWNISGIGATNVTYGADGTASVRSNSTSSGYEGASGSNNVMMAAAGASFLINGIDPLGMTNMQLSFGANEANAILKLYYNTGDANWEEVPFDKTAAEWGLVNVSFTLPDGSTVLNLKFTAGATQYGTRVDDIKLIGGGTPVLGDLRVSPANLGFVAAGEAKTFTITSTSTWTATETVDWLSVLSDNGNGNSTVTVTAAANTGSARTATITVTSGTETKTVNVSQAAPESGNDGSKEHPYSISEAMSHQGSASNTDYKWVKGYIVGVVETAGGTNTPNFAGSYTNQTNLLLAATADETSWDNCLSVQLPTDANAPGIRSALNLNAHPENKGKEVLLEGTLEMYFSRSGLKNTRAYEWVSATGSTLELAPASKTFTAAAGTQDVTVTSNTDWTVSSSDETWCTVSPTTGSNNGAFTVSVTANDGALRAATVTVKTSDDEVTRFFAVTQETSETPVTSLSQDWESATEGGAQPTGWISQAVGSATDKSFTVAQYSSSKFAQVTSYGGASGDHEIWLISPALDLDGANTNVVSFKTAGAYFADVSSLEVYLLDSKSAGSVTKLAARIAASTDPKDGNYSLWIPSGDIDLSAYSGTKYIGFRYTGQGGSTSGFAATYRIDDFLFGANAPEELAVAPASLDFVATGGAQSFTVISNIAWTVNSSETWCSVSPTGGNGTDAVTVTAEANSGAARAATITISGTGVSDKTIAVTQASSGAGVNFPKVEWDFTTISSNATVTSLASTAGSGTLTITANSGSFTANTGDYVVASNWAVNASWNIEIPVSGFAGGTIKLSFDAQSSNTGPRDFAAEWSADGTNWSTPTNDEKYTLANARADKIIVINPSGLTDKLYIRLRVASNISVRAGTGSYAADEAFQAGGTSRLTAKLTVEEQ